MARWCTTSKERSLSAPHANAAALLAAHGLAGAREAPFAHKGFSGATLTRLRRGDGASFVLKRMSIESDWIMRATEDESCREAAFAAASIVLPDGVRTPTLGTALDDDGHALLMHDISDRLLPQGAIVASTLDAIIARMAELHTLPLPSPDALPWCGIRQRLTLLTPATAPIAEAYGAPVTRDLINGWSLFERHAPPDVAALIRSLSGEPTPLLRALDALPNALLHGDLKLDNIGIDSEGRLWLIDWAMTLLAPPAVELGWFLAMNSRRIPRSLDDVMSHYAAKAQTADRERHDALTVLCGLLLRGWRKALDAEEGQPDDLRWWCDRAREAARFL